MRNLKMNKHTVATYILYASFVAFSFASAVTTYMGVGLVLISYDPLIKHLISFCISFATSGVMFYIGLHIPEYFYRHNVSMPVLGYFAIATVSIFFNFVTFYQGQIMALSLDDDVRDLNNDVEVIYSIGVDNLSRYCLVNAWKDSLAVASAGMVSEEEHGYQAGKGVRWQEHFSRYNVYENKLKDAIALYDKRKAALDKMYSSVNGYLVQADKSNNVKEREDHISKVLVVLDRMIGFAKSVGYGGGAVVTTSSYMKIKRPDYVLGVIIDAFEDYGKMNSSDRSKIALSAFLSVILDLPIFVVLLLLGDRNKGILETLWK